MNTFEVAIPMKDHPLVISVKQRENKTSTYDLYYNNDFCGCIFCNEHNVWIYEPHHHAALLLDEEQIMHLGHEIGEHSKC